MTAATSYFVPTRAIAVAAMLGSAACWGGATVMTKGALDAFDPFILLVIQLVASDRALDRRVSIVHAAFGRAPDDAGGIDRRA